jgi:hypothetical protein
MARVYSSEAILRKNQRRKSQILISPLLGMREFPPKRFGTLFNTPASWAKSNILPCSATAVRYLDVFSMQTSSELLPSFPSFDGHQRSDKKSVAEAASARHAIVLIYAVIVCFPTQRT